MKLIEDKEISVNGIITRSFFTRGKYIHNFTDGKEEVELIHNAPLELGPVKITGKVENHYGMFKIKVYEAQSLEQDKYKEIEEIAQENAPIKEIEFLIKDEITEKLKEKLIKIAKKLYSAQRLRRNTVIRFHNDGDGIAGALSLTFFLKGKFTQQNSAVYAVRDAMRDLNELTNSKNSLLILVDFGSNEESKEALSLIKSAGIEIISIDHHPYFDKLNEYTSIFVNPWEFSNPENASKYSAGYLCAEISRILGNDADSYARIALSSDKSDLLEAEQKEKNSGIVLNYAAAYSSYGNNLEFYSNILSNPELFNSMLFQAKEKIDQLLLVAKNQLKKKEIGEFKIYVINLGNLVKKFEFPGLGKSATQVYESLIPKEEPSILIAYGSRTIVFRIADKAFEKGADANKIIDHLKNTMPDFVEGGGGHTKAAAIRVKENYEDSAVNQILEFLK